MARSVDLKAAWERLQADKGVSVPREGAEVLGVPEAVLQNALAGPSVIRLRPKFAEILEAMPKLGRLMTIVRNDNFVAMPVGDLEELTIDGKEGHAQGGPIDISFDLSRWGSAFALIEESDSSVRRILYFFDERGDSALRALVWWKGGEDVFDDIVQRFRDPAPGDVVGKPTIDADWQSSSEFASGRSVAADAPKRTVALLEAIIAHEVMVDWIIPARASKARYVGPIRGLRTGHREGWYDAHYPHFNTRIAAVNVARLAAVEDADTRSPIVGLIDAHERIMCRAGIAKDNSTKTKAAWREAVNAAFAD